MKNQVYNFALLILLSLPLSLFAESRTETFTQKHSKSFSISQGATLDLDCSFAEVTIENWDRNEISIDGKVEIEAKDQEKADKYFDKVTVKMSQSGDRVYLEVDLGNGKGWDGKNSINSEIAFTLKVPSWINLDADVSFGRLDVQEISGEAEISIEYSGGDLQALLHPSTRLDCSFSGVDVGEFGGGKIDNAFGELTIKALNGNARIDSSYGSVDIQSLGSGVTEVEIDNGFGDFNMNVSNSQTYEVNIDSSFGDVRCSGDWNVLRSSKDWNEQEIKGLLGAGSTATAHIEVENSFGDVHLK